MGYIGAHRDRKKSTGSRELAASETLEGFKRLTSLGVMQGCVGGGGGVELPYLNRLNSAKRATLP